MDFAKLATLDFAAPDADRFPALRLAERVLAAGGLAGTVLNAAKEEAMHGFLARRVGFLSMADLVEGALDALPCEGEPGDLSSVLEMDAAARSHVRKQIS